MASPASVVLRDHTLFTLSYLWQMPSTRIFQGGDFSSIVSTGIHLRIVPVISGWHRLLRLLPSHPSSIVPGSGTAHLTVHRVLIRVVHIRLEALNVYAVRATFHSLLMSHTSRVAILSSIAATISAYKPATRRKLEVHQGQRIK